VEATRQRSQHLQRPNNVNSCRLNRCLPNLQLLEVWPIWLAWKGLNNLTFKQDLVREDHAWPDAVHGLTAASKCPSLKGYTMLLAESWHKRECMVHGAIPGQTASPTTFLIALRINLRVCESIPTHTPKVLPFSKFNFALYNGLLFSAFRDSHYNTVLIFIIERGFIATIFSDSRRIWKHKFKYQHRTKSASPQAFQGYK
jgi:hypothetical protein